MFSFSTLLFVAAFARASGEELYRKVALSDCAHNHQLDVKPQPACSGRNQSVAVLEACCDKTQGCGGFNTHGVIKDLACSTDIRTEPTTDLYLKLACNAFKTENTCPQPSCTWTPPARRSPNGTCVQSPPGISPPMPWPLPHDVSNGGTTVQLSPSFAIVSAAGQTSPTLDTAVRRYQAQVVGVHIASPQGGTAPLATWLQKLVVQVANFDETYPQLSTAPGNEAYSLNIPANGSAATISADTIWGAMWGMESFSQLVRFNFTSEAYSIANAPWVSRV
jgi:hypothetical protein